jgi:hypothetical protein
MFKTPAAPFDNINYSISKEMCAINNRRDVQAYISKYNIVIEMQEKTDDLLILLFDKNKIIITTGDMYSNVQIGNINYVNHFIQIPANQKCRFRIVC